MHRQAHSRCKGRHTPGIKAAAQAGEHSRPLACASYGVGVNYACKQMIYAFNAFPPPFAQSCGLEPLTHPLTPCPVPIHAHLIHSKPYSTSCTAVNTGALGRLVKRQTSCFFTQEGQACVWSTAWRSLFSFLATQRGQPLHFAGATAVVCSFTHL